MRTASAASLGIGLSRMADTPDMLPMLRLRLAEAEMAVHNLAIGKGAQSVAYEGKSVSYTQANRSDLMLYIGGLKDRIAALEGGRVRRGPIHLTF